MMKNVLTVCTILLLAGGCSPAEGPTQGEAPAPAPVDPQQELDNGTPGEVESIGAADDQTAGLQLLSLEELLPEQFGVVTRPWLGDLDGMAERHAIRVLVISGGPQFFYSNGRPRGMIIELLTRFQKHVNESLGRGLHAVEIIPMPVSRNRLIPALLAGQADLIAADLTITEHRSELVDFSLPLIRDIDEVMIFGPGASAGIDSIEDLAGKSVYVRRSSSYFEHLESLNRDFEDRGLDPIQIEPANEMLRTQDILEMANAGLISATVLDSYRANYWAQIFSNLEVRSDLVVNSGGDIAWVFRKDSPQLADAVNSFVRQHRQGTLIGNVLIQRYLSNAQWVRNATNRVGLERLRPTLEFFRAGAEIARLDPLMLVAQAYQESELDNSRTSSAGAVGIMQIKPSTAADKNVGIEDVNPLADNIRAGAIYMRFLMDRYFAGEDMHELEQWLFALAAYNAGPARIRRIRQQAEAEGHDPNRWLENVEIVAARQIGRETVNYVRNVFKYYIAYRMAWEEQQLRQPIDDLQMLDLDPAQQPN